LKPTDKDRIGSAGAMATC